MAARGPQIGPDARPLEPPPGERRRGDRLDASIQATVRLAELPEAGVMRARVLDISEAGVRVRTRRRLPEGARVLLDMECVLPLRVHLGYDAHSLVVDGPMHTHLVRIAGEVARVERTPSRTYEVGIAFCDETTRFDELQLVQFYVDHLRDRESWSL